MIKQLLPETIDNHFRGLPIAKWVFIGMTIFTIGRSLAHIFLPDGGAQSIATIPLDAFSAVANIVVIGMFAQWGLTQLMFGLMYLLVVLRYQSLIPLMWLFLFAEWTGRFLLGFYKPLESTGTAPGAIGNMIFPVLTFVMLFLALRVQKD